jgi:type IV secretion system protein VirB10
MAIAANAFRSDGVVVPLGGPFTDDLGRMGVPGQVDNRFWQRFGNAILMDAALALISLPQTALATRTPGNTFLSINPTSTEGVLSEVLRNSVNLPPVLRKNQGEQVMLLITQPIHVGAVNFQMEGR